MAESSCPVCKVALKQAGYTERCPQCEGAWIHEDALVGMLQERTSAMVSLPWQPRDKDAERACAVCAKPMQMVKLGSVALDRCGDHGVWFDAHELAALLGEAKSFKSEPRDGGSERGLLRSLARLFGG